jgi:carbon monoxide dehydrogenase subunit G
MLTRFLIALAVVVILFIVAVASRPSTFRIMRSATVAAPPEVVFMQVYDLHRFQEWSPWAKLDPGCKTTFDGPGAGVGAAFSWSGNKKVGEGRMTLTESRPPEFIGFKLEFLTPFKATNTTEFTFKPDGGQTVVTWAMSGKCNFMAKAFGLFMNCDKMVGGDFEKGLAQMKSLAEAAAQTGRAESRLAYSGSR